MAIKSNCDDPHSINFMGRDPETGAKPGGFYNETFVNGEVKHVYVNRSNMMASSDDIAAHQGFIFEP
jgi:hypothetical protein